MGVAGTSLTPEQEDLMQRQVDEAGETFKADIMKTRKMVKPEDLQGQSMTGREAVAKHLATGLVPNLKALLTQLEGKGWVAKSV
jgi:ClpP class serine protease